MYPKFLYFPPIVTGECDGGNQGMLPSALSTGCHGDQTWRKSLLLLLYSEEADGTHLRGL